MIINTHTPYPKTAELAAWREWSQVNYNTSYAASVLRECYTDEELQAELDKGVHRFCVTVKIWDDMHAGINNS